MLCLRSQSPACPSAFHASGKWEANPNRNVRPSCSAGGGERLSAECTFPTADSTVCPPKSQASGLFFDFLGPFLLWLGVALILFSYA